MCEHGCGYCGPDDQRQKELGGGTSDGWCTACGLHHQCSRDTWKTSRQVLIAFRVRPSPRVLRICTAARNPCLLLVMRSESGPHWQHHSTQDTDTRPRRVMCRHVRCSCRVYFIPSRTYAPLHASAGCSSIVGLLLGSVSSRSLACITQDLSAPRLRDVR